MRVSLGILISIALLTSCVTAKGGRMEPVVVRIDPAVKFQTVRHFGASAAWWAQSVGTWDTDTRERLLDYLFDKKAGIGLDIVRYNLGGGKERAIVTDPLRTASCIETDEGSFDWRRDAAAIEIVNGAVSRGAKVVLFSNSPPSRLTVTGAPTGNGPKSNLQAGKEGEFAAFLANAAEYLKRELGWPIVDISPINEPQWNWSPKNGQEGSHWSPEESLRMVRALRDELSSRGLGYGISAVDSAEMKIATNHQYINGLFSDPVLGPSLGHYAVHSYWSSLYDRQDLSAYLGKRYPDIELWMTEWTEMQEGKDLGMDAALTLAATVHQDLTHASASSWQYWIAASPYDYRDGLVYIDPVTETFEVSKKLFALGNWSRFIEADAERIQIAVEGDDTLQASCFLNPDGSVVAVFVNMNADRGRSAELAGIGPEFSDIRAYETSDERSLEPAALGAAGRIIIPPRSVVTAVLKR